VKPKKARHDAHLYRLYQKVTREIECSGGKVRRVVLDFELKKDLYQALSRMRPDKDPRYERIFIANQFDLKVVHGKIPIPDLRIEYEDDCRDVHRLDLEIATRDYRPQGLGEKGASGFHTFRHSAASIVNEQTGNLKLAQKFLGHSTIKMTADIYTHTSAEAEREAALAVEGAIYGDLFPVVPNIENRNNSVALN
jgi:integrase